LPQPSGPHWSPEHCGTQPELDVAVVAVDVEATVDAVVLVAEEVVDDVAAPPAPPAPAPLLEAAVELVALALPPAPALVVVACEDTQTWWTQTSKPTQSPLDSQLVGPAPPVLDAVPPWLPQATSASAARRASHAEGTSINWILRIASPGA
jgi:hypothetical protein